VQDNFARSGKNVLRGLHYQVDPAGQAKLVRVVRGAVFDVAVDLRRDSPTFGRWVGETLTEDNHRMLYIPEGFAHGYVVLSDVADFVYKVSSEYAPDLERGVRWDCPEIGISWPVTAPTLSPKDRSLPSLSRAELFEPKQPEPTPNRG
jgi:dTDP-4-dehydrorhamnose 3,5-epimerase